MYDVHQAAALSLLVFLMVIEAIMEFSKKVLKN